MCVFNVIFSLFIIMVCLVDLPVHTRQILYYSFKSHTLFLRQVFIMLYGLPLNLLYSPGLVWSFENLKFVKWIEMKDEAGVAIQIMV